VARGGGFGWARLSPLEKKHELWAVDGGFGASPEQHRSIDVVLFGLGVLLAVK